MSMPNFSAPLIYLSTASTAHVFQSGQVFTSTKCSVLCLPWFSQMRRLEISSNSFTSTKSWERFPLCYLCRTEAGNRLCPVWLYRKHSRGFRSVDRASLSRYCDNCTILWSSMGLVSHGLEHVPPE